MPSLHILSTFFGVAVLLALTPGPDNLFVLLQSAQRGWRAGMAVVLGLCMGLVVHTAAVALGLAALFAASPTAFTVLKFCGAAYLAWLAWQALRAPAGAAQDSAHAGDAARGGQGPAAAPQAELAAVPGLVRMVGRGMLMNLTNPKVLIFFLAFLPQFTDPARGSVAAQTMVLGLVFMLATLLVFGAIACFSGAFGALLQRSARARTVLNRVAGLVFLGLAVRLASS
ncbi:LysE family translocator [Extensimonas vulgaris]|uniref:Threonine/homoserine/homoserine lactone efflux protein n=1 Tax=Extensimonas vulgaris TaxID=1031594 RepID=A0A369AQL2_9BURK|nr:LysE family translocator [Extensimonas vulgaris]RCX11659.1 threonine/homoserine/homoserine lactone efflux protein [Extensimonas vulgaris]TWI40554.1 threonine/homoserine/homoserine lactone efflux protein [Extensimonas vulgaris]TXD16568.1 LysE family translocator [Extensimonas vulgaris]